MKSNNLNKQYKGDINNQITTKLDYLSILASSIKVDNNKDNRTLDTKFELILKGLLGNKFLEYLQNLTQFLIILKKPIGILRVEFRILKREATKYSIQD